MIAIRLAIAPILMYTAVLSPGAYKLNALDIMIRNAVSMISKRIIFMDLYILSFTLLNEQYPETWFKMITYNSIVFWDELISRYIKIQVFAMDNPVL